MIVEAVKPNPKNEKQGFVKFDDGTEAWTPEVELAQALVGKEIPSDWKLQDGKNGGKQLLPPKQGRSSAPAAFRNTKEGFLLEQAHWDRKQAIDQRATNARTALMQAVQWTTTMPEAQKEVTVYADGFFEWLEAKSAGGVSVSPLPPPAGEGSRDPFPSPSPTASPEANRNAGTATKAVATNSTGGDASDGGGATVSREGAATPAACSHQENTTLKLDGGDLPAGLIRCVNCNFTRKGAD